MDDFAHRTGLTSENPPARYLWTDAFAVCNWLGLHEGTGEDRYLELATRLVEQVHRVLGRHRSDDPRSGWISGLPEADGARHPTAGGLRIGKPRNERQQGERFDPQLEWDRDGQYYHYLTRWMFALNRMWRVTAEREYHRLAVELARAAHRGFLVETSTGRRLAWKMSVDLSRPQIPSSGHHDPLDGLITTSVVAATRPESVPEDVLSSEIEELAELCRGRSWITDDPLGLGGLLVDVLRCAQLIEAGHPTGLRHFTSVASDAGKSLEAMSEWAFLSHGSERRLAFRELGLALGLRALDRLGHGGVPARVAEAAVTVRGLSRYRHAVERIVDFWSRDEARASPTWVDHRDISDVMWCTTLQPDGFLDL